jgi:tetratricopeptide (TPR) repeat protein
MSRDTFYPEDFFKAGGALSPDTPSYVTRAADAELKRTLLRGEYCNVLAARQMGKSSLKSHVLRTLRTEGVRTVAIDLTTGGTTTGNDAIEQWYFGLISRIRRQLRLSVDETVWWRTHAQLDPVQRFSNFMRDMVLEEVAAPVVIFIDEIDSTLNLPFTDDFFAAIRAMYNARADDLAYKRLAFVLLGVAHPADLIKDHTRTPYNIGSAIDVRDFTPEEARVLLPGLEAAHLGQGEAILSRILYWTSGHPYLTQVLCLNIAADKSPVWRDEDIDAVVTETFLSDAARKESNLKFVQDKLLPHPQRVALLKLYRQVLRGQEIADDGQSQLHNMLKLAGLVKVTDGTLRVRNRIYRQVFSRAWVRENLPTNWRAWVTALVALIALVALGLIANNMRIDYQLGQISRNFNEAPPAEQRADLAWILRCWNPLNLRGYGREARDHFFAPGMTREEQLSLFPRTVNPDARRDVQTLIAGLYTTLADVDGDGRSTELLQTMHDALPQGDLRAELAAWLEARAAVDTATTLENYNAALTLNPDNPATLYERAALYAEIGEYDRALADLDRVMGIVLDTAEPTPTPQPTNITSPTPSPSATPTIGGETVLTPTARPGEATPMPTSESEPPSGSEEKPPEIPAVSSQPEIPFSTQFDDYAARRSAVKALIARTPDLIDTLLVAPVDAYPNLRESDLVLTPTPEITSTFKLQTDLIVYACGYVGRSDICTVDLSGDTRTLISSAYDDAEPDWSPDGQQLVFHSNRAGNYDIFLSDAQGQNIQNLTDTSGEDERMPDWSSGGLVYEVGDGVDNGEIWVIDGDRTYFLATGRAPAWGPDGELVAFMQKQSDGYWQIYVQDVQTGAMTALYHPGEHCRFPSWSPDGKWIAYNTFVFSSHPQGSTYDLWRMRADGSGSPQRLTTAGESGRPSWSPDGQRIIYDYGDYLYILEVSSGSMKKLNRTQNGWAPDWLW